MIDKFRRIVSLGIKMDAESLLLYEFIKIHLTSGDAVIKEDDGKRYMLLNKELLSQYFPEYKKRSWQSTGSRINSMVRDQVLERCNLSPMLFVGLGEKSLLIEGFRQPVFEAHIQQAKKYDPIERRKWLEDELKRLGYPQKLMIKEKERCYDTFVNWWSEHEEGGKCKFDKTGGFNVDFRIREWAEKGTKQGTYTSTILGGS